LQKPHPPLWVACSALDTIEMAGRRGLGALAFQFLSADAAHA
jgi:alkanesulfonate monooxygenase SsuD/methylene tetrahydromethanopterin reductase-like flavin-dependent oxidoreductase (luciferase family)